MVVAVELLKVLPNALWDAAIAKCAAGEQVATTALNVVHRAILEANVQALVTRETPRGYSRGATSNR